MIWWNTCSALPHGGRSKTRKNSIFGERKGEETMSTQHKFSMPILEEACRRLGFAVEEASAVARWGQKKGKRVPAGYFLVRGKVKGMSCSVNEAGEMVSKPKKKGLIFAHVHKGGSSGGNFRLKLQPEVVRGYVGAHNWLENRLSFKTLVETMLEVDEERRFGKG